MTPVVGTYTPGTTFDEYEETKYIVYKQASPVISPYLDPAAMKPFFGFSDLTYNAGVLNIRNSCPITYTLKESPAGAPINFSLTTISGTTGYDGTYRLTLDLPLIAPVHETPGTYEVIVEGEAQGNSNKF